MLNVGEQIAASYLRYVRKCDFIQTNLYTKDVQGEIDVVGIDLAESKVYLCEVAVHLTTGLFYQKDGRYNNVGKLTDKFSKDIEYARQYLSDYTPTFMLWSPIVRNSKGNQANNQAAHLEAIHANIMAKYQVDIEMVVNDTFRDYLNQMREVAAGETSELQCPIMRFMQLESYLDRHIARQAQRAGK